MEFINLSSLNLAAFYSKKYGFERGWCFAQSGLYIPGECDFTRSIGHIWY